MRDIREMGLNFERYAQVGRNEAERKSARIVAKTLQGLDELNNEGVLSVPETLVFPKPGIPYTETIDEKGRILYDYPHEHRYHEGYRELVKSMYDIKPIKKETPDQRIEREAQEQKLQEVFEDPKRTEQFEAGMEEGFRRLKPREYQALSLYYGLDNTENKGRTWEDVGEEMSVSRSRAGEILRNTVYKLHYFGEKFFVAYLPEQVTKWKEREEARRESIKRIDLIKSKLDQFPNELLDEFSDEVEDDSL